MRTLFGIILGATITVGAAYVHDTQYAAPLPSAPGAARTIVNWDVAREVTGNTFGMALRQIDRLVPR